MSGAACMQEWHDSASCAACHFQYLSVMTYWGSETKVNFITVQQLTCTLDSKWLRLQRLRVVASYVNHYDIVRHTSGALYDSFDVICPCDCMRCRTWAQLSDQRCPHSQKSQLVLMPMFLVLIYSSLPGTRTRPDTSLQSHCSLGLTPVSTKGYKEPWDRFIRLGISSTQVALRSPLTPSPHRQYVLSGLKRQQLRF